jgi:FkbM family methyltransferase
MASPTRPHASIRAALALDPPAESLLLESHVGPVLVAQGSPYVRSLPRHPVHDPGVIHFMEKHRARLFPFFDVGANVGLFSIVAAGMRRPGDRILAFEPGAQNLDLLARNLAAHGIGGIEIWPVAVTAADGPVWLGAISCGVAAISDGEKRAYPGRSLASVIAETGVTPGFVKLDIEGGEMRALQGLRAAPGFRSMVIELEFSWRDHHARLDELLALCPPGDWAWEFLLSDTEIGFFPRAQRIEVVSRYALHAFTATTPADLAELLAALKASTAERPSRKWELCLTACDTSGAAP